MTAPSLVLYVDAQYASPYAMSAFVSLHEKGLSFNMKTVDLGAGENLLPAFARTSLTCRVPTLVHGDFRLSESSAISEYLDEVFPDAGIRLYPGDSRKRARARQVQAWLRSDMLALRRERSTEVVFYGRTAAALSAQARAAADKLCAAAGALLEDDDGYICGDWCIADVDLALMLNRLVLHGDEVPPRLVAYAHRQWARPSVQMWIAQQRPPL